MFVKQAFTMKSQAVMYCSILRRGTELREKNK